jgi:hypothetical protein
MTDKSRIFFRNFKKSSIVLWIGGGLIPFAILYTFGNILSIGRYGHQRLGIEPLITSSFSNFEAHVF